MSAIVIKDGGGTTLDTVSPQPNATSGTAAYSSSGTGNLTVVVNAQPFYNTTTMTHNITKTAGDGGITTSGNSFVWDRTAGATVSDVISMANHGQTATFTLTITLTKS